MCIRDRFYKELSDWLLGKQNSQPELISTLKEIGITGFRDGTETVSYTHLDVYKRQVLLTEFNKLANNAIEPSCTDAHIFNEIMMSLVDSSCFF